MTDILTHETTNDSAGLGGLFERFRKSIADYRVFRQTVQELESLSDRELNDLGLSRSSLRDVAREAAYDI